MLQLEQQGASAPAAPPQGAFNSMLTAQTSAALLRSSGTPTSAPAPHLSLQANPPSFMSASNYGPGLNALASLAAAQSVPTATSPALDPQGPVTAALRSLGLSGATLSGSTADAALLRYAANPAAATAPHNSLMNANRPFGGF